MRELPILFSTPMLRAILDGRKTQTRRLMKPQPGLAPSMLVCHDAHVWMSPNQVREWRCPYGQPGDLLWVREAHAPIIGQDGYLIEIDYRATYEHGARLGDRLGLRKRWTPAIHMRREYSRILLGVTDVRVERLDQISEEDAIAEGIEPGEDFFNCPTWKCYGEYAGTSAPDDPVDSYQTLWESIHGPGSWDENPWVWVVSFRRIEQEARA